MAAESLPSILICYASYGEASFHFCLFLHYTETINKGVAEKLVFSTVFKTDVR